VADRSPLFNPPQDRVPDSDPAIVRVPLDHMPWSARKSQQHAWDKGDKSIKHVPNGN
jgi:hypothetical protein